MGPIDFTAEQRADSFRGNEFLTMIGRIKRKQIVQTSAGRDEHNCSACH